MSVTVLPCEGHDWFNKEFPFSIYPDSFVALSTFSEFMGSFVTEFLFLGRSDSFVASKSLSRHLGYFFTEVPFWRLIFMGSLDHLLHNICISDFPINLFHQVRFP